MSLLVPPPNFSSAHKQAQGVPLQPMMSPGPAQCRPTLVAASFCPVPGVVANAAPPAGQMLRMRVVASPHSLPAGVAAVPAAASSLVPGVAPIGMQVPQQRSHSQTVARPSSHMLRSPQMSSSRSLLDVDAKNVCSISTASTDTSFALNLSRLVEDVEIPSSSPFGSGTPTLPGTEDAITSFLQQIGVPGSGTSGEATVLSLDDVVKCCSMDALLAINRDSLAPTPRDTFPLWPRLRMLSQPPPARTPRDASTSLQVSVSKFSL